MEKSRFDQPVVMKPLVGLALSCALVSSQRLYADQFYFDTPHHTYFAREVKVPHCDGSLSKGHVVVEATHAGKTFVLRDCDDILQGIHFLCAGMNVGTGKEHVECGSNWLRVLLDKRLLGADDARRARRTLSSAEKLLAGIPGRFTADDVTPNWTLAWIVEELAERFHFNPLRALEVGSFEGRSAHLWHLLLPKGSNLTCADLEFHPFFFDNVRLLTSSGFLTATQGPSSQTLRSLEADSFELVFVDGSHAGPEVLQDIVMADILLKVNGLLLLDDITWSGVANSVQRRGATFEASARGGNSVARTSILSFVAGRKRRPRVLRRQQTPV